MEHLANAFGRADERSGQDQVAEPKAGKQRLAEAAGVEHTVHGIDALQGRRLATAVVEFAVVVVFQHP